MNHLNNVKQRIIRNFRGQRGGQVKVKIFETKRKMGKAAAEEAARILKSTIKEKGKAVLVVATGASQFEIWESLTSTPSVDWSKTTIFQKVLKGEVN